ncbi:transposase [Lentzea sp. NPDC004782]|uniref:transposase n=1 Tax=Lentzea sp. NPDC004782 TaxID=3154458 RepID=UPI00339F30AA
MREEVLTDELWARLEPLIPVSPRRFRYPGRGRADDRAALEGILHAARTGIGWNRLPTALCDILDCRRNNLEVEVRGCDERWRVPDHLRLVIFIAGEVIGGIGGRLGRAGCSQGLRGGRV